MSTHFPPSGSPLPRVLEWILSLRNRILSHLPEVLLGIAILAYVIYFSVASIYRIHVYVAHYFDLGIMHQTTYNTYKALSTFDWSRFLELTDPFEPYQIKRMAIHNDMILALIAPLYFIWDGPETLLVVQTVAIGLGALSLYLVGTRLFSRKQYARWLSLAVAAAYLLYPMTAYVNLFDFHGVALSMAFLPFMVYYWLCGKYRLSFLFAVLAMLTKEQVALTVGFFGLFAAYTAFFHAKKRNARAYVFPGTLFLISIAWFFLVMKVIIPISRPDGTHFALEYYGKFGSSSAAVVVNLLLNPVQAAEYLTHAGVIEYLRTLLQPVAYLPLLGLPALAAAAPEFGINILSSNGNMRMIIYHYTAVLIPFIFIATLYGMRFLLGFAERHRPAHTGAVAGILVAVLLAFTGIAAVSFGPLPGSKTEAVHMFGNRPATRDALIEWAQKLESDEISVAATGKFAPYFTSRRYFYLMSDRYEKADYVIVNPQEVYESYGSEWAIPGYEALRQDPRYYMVENRPGLQVFKRLTY
ncbi:MAG: DUF2079 domain-containing protein [Patescibacteria group bacterium]|nr:DUF2079 domain-containing protein [Patescibacteria group bacterium]